MANIYAIPSGYINETSQRQYAIPGGYVDETSAPVSTVTLTGVHGTGTVGAVRGGPVRTVSLTGVSGTGAVGTVRGVASHNVAVTGVHGIGTVGDLTATMPVVSISGVAGISAVGSLTGAFGYQPTLIYTQNEGIWTGEGNSGGFPTSFNNYLLSMWVCFGGGDFTVSNQGCVVIVMNASGLSLQVTVDGPSNYAINQGFSFDPITYRSNFLLSINPVTQQIQAYVNDVALDLSSVDWLKSGAFSLTGFLSYWQIATATENAIQPGIGDVFLAAPSAFYDLSITANRRAFINADLTPVNLQLNPSTPLGVPPPIFLTVKDGLASDFLTNYGIGGPFTIINTDAPLSIQPPTCALPTPPAPPYALNPVQGLFQNDSICPSFPATFPNVLLSCWVEEKPDDSGWQMFAISTDLDDNNQRGFSVELDPPAFGGALNVTVANGHQYDGSLGQFGFATFDGSALVAGTFYNILISISGPNNVVQCYVNDVALTLSSSTWFDTTNIAAPQNLGQGSIGLGAENNFVGTNPCMADAFWATPTSFYDLTVEANRRKFINADLSPVYLGSNGQLPLGTAPLILLSLPPGDPIDDWNTNLGSGGGAFSGDATPCGPTVTAELTMSAFNVTAPAVITSDNNLILRWSDTRGASWANPIKQSLGAGGYYDTDVSFRRLGYARDRVVELSWSSANFVSLTGVFILADIGAT